MQLFGKSRQHKEYINPMPTLERPRFHQSSHLWLIFDEVYEERDRQDAGADGSELLRSWAEEPEQRLKGVYPGMVITGGVDGDEGPEWLYALASEVLSSQKVGKPISSTK